MRIIECKKTLTIKDYFNINHSVMDFLFSEMHVMLEHILKSPKIDQKCNTWFEKGNTWLKN